MVSNKTFWILCVACLALTSLLVTGCIHADIGNLR